MKPRSIISLIIAAVLVLGGIITCAVASAKAKTEGVMLFPEADTDGNLVYKMDLDGTTKITVDCADADITVIGGAEKSVIEVVNFNANYYKLSQSNGSLNFGQVDDFLSMFKFWDNGFSFKGMRYILRFGDDAAGEKQVIVRLADTDSISLVNLSTVTGTVSIEDCAFAADYTVRSTSGKIELADVTGAASISLSGDSAELSAENCQAQKLSVTGDTLSAVLSDVTADESTVNNTAGSVEIKNGTFKKLNATTVSGSIAIAPYGCAEGSLKSDSGKISVNFVKNDSLAASVSTTTGRINVNGEYVESFSKNAPSQEHRINITTSSGDVIITHPVE